ncbi:efflux RND transporter periplasmic adaptor subunit [Saccharothrix syringae]|uniref:Uncharacterized protein n=1 Tax=Saccharothrix syringae TaxID=103733 RepID=A0A5Q0H6H6_SACSY|nr:hypothetical protein [Saccharothrix syringae]QFZ21515.1 hypothetical protein EKG83_32665 [Saccharothrix syringae]
MKRLFRVLLPVVAVIAAATTALAAPVPPTTPYPEVPPNADACRVEKLEIQKQQLLHDQAKREYERIKALVPSNAASVEELRTAERALHLAAIALNNAKYAEAACRNKLGNDPKKECVGLSLELNRLLDELALRKELERLAKESYDAALALLGSGAVSREEVERRKTAWEVAKVERQQVEARIEAVKKQLADNPACKDYPSTRPTPTSTTPTSTPPSTTSPGTTAPTTTTTQPTTTQPTTTRPSTAPPSTTDAPSTTALPTSAP